MNTRLPYMKMVAGQFTPFSAQISCTMNMESMIARREFRKLGHHSDSCGYLVKKYVTLDQTGSKYGNCIWLRWHIYRV